MQNYILTKRQKESKKNSENVMKTGNLLCRGLRETKENGMIKILGNRNKGEVLWLHTESEK